nr:alpha/beta fold hydrolase [Planosporangium mesophilum]
MEAGLGLPGSAWRRLCEHLPGDRAVLRYDRAGLGRSDPGALPRTGARQARELRELLRALDLPAPYVLVGHSAGAFVVRLFAHAHPDEVAALVLVDPSHEDEGPALRPVTRWAEASLSRLLRVAHLMSWSKHLAGTVREDEAFTATAEEVRQARRRHPLPDVPLRVITARYPGWLPPGRSRRRESDRIRSLHRALAASVPRGRHLLARSGHLVMRDAPRFLASVIAGTHP